MWVDVKIESRDVRGAKRVECARCPGARAIQRFLDPKYQAQIVDVGIKTVDLHIEFVDVFDCFCDDPPAIPIPNTLAEYVEKYDASKPGKPPKPVSFRLNIPKRFLRSTN